MKIKNKVKVTGYKEIEIFSNQCKAIILRQTFLTIYTIQKPLKHIQVYKNLPNLNLVNKNQTENEKLLQKIWKKVFLEKEIIHVFAHKLSRNI